MLEISDIISILDEINNDKTVPKNIRTAISKVKEDLKNNKMEKNVKINAAISILDEAANDTNIPVYTRTQIMSIVSQLESMDRD